MNAKELLELAAKAAGIEYASTEKCGLSLASAGYWNPLTDDGDALRLAVDLGLGVGVGIAWAGHLGTPTVWIHDVSSTDKHAATRRAIVRAAAEIGKGMP